MKLTFFTLSITAFLLLLADASYGKQVLLYTCEMEYRAPVFSDPGKVSQGGVQQVCRIRPVEEPDEVPSRQVQPFRNLFPKLVGTWRADFLESGQAFSTVAQLRRDGTIYGEVLSVNGVVRKLVGKWGYSNGMLFERYSDGSSAQSSVKWLTDNQVELTIVNNGTASQAGRKFMFYR
ncbi:hypothetical protein [Phormidesmis priestleyi]